MTRTIIPDAAALRVFSEVWSQYQALLEADIPDPSVLEFILDVEAQFRRLFPDSVSCARAHRQLMHDPHHRAWRSTRAALGSAFLATQIWPVKNYFANGK